MARHSREDALFMEDSVAESRDSRDGGRLAERRKPARRQTEAHPRAGRAGYAALCLALMAGILAMLALGARQVQQHRRFMQMKTAVERQSFYDGTTVEGVDVSGMTLADATAYWRERVEPGYSGRAVALDNGDTLTALDLGYASDYENVLASAWSAGRSGSLEERYRMISSRVSHPVAYQVTRTAYSEAAIESYVRSVAEAVDRPARDAAVESFDITTFKFVIAPEADGAKLDADALRRDIAGALDAGGGDVKLSVSAVAPLVRSDEVAAQYGVITTAITNASSSSRARIANIRLAMQYINGTRVAPGEVFSFNGTVGERTTSRGFQTATAYSGGEVTEQVGGGICQVSTTLFNAAVKADLEIIERHSHSLTVGYVDKGKDATVNWGSQDLRFRNTSDDDIYIACYLTDDKRVRFGIFGKLLPAGETITVEARTTQTIPFDTIYQLSPALWPGQTYVARAGRDGCNAEAYKIRWDAAGNQISRELLCKSAYKKVDQIVLYGQ